MRRTQSDQLHRQSSDDDRTPCSPLIPAISRSLALFALAAVAEIGGGYLMWRWLRDGRSIFVGIAGAALLVLYGVIPTLQPATFGRTYAACLSCYRCSGAGKLTAIVPTPPT